MVETIGGNETTSNLLWQLPLGTGGGGGKSPLNPLHSKKKRGRAGVEGEVVPAGHDSKRVRISWQLSALFKNGAS